MDWYDRGHGMTGWGWAAMTVGLVLVLALLVLGGVMLARSSRRPPDGSYPAPPGSSAEQLLAERFARGEIDEEEYRRRLATLRGAGSGSAPR
ncbi:MAG TPA: SHOCT domain-containing protein [Blastococcus sp.]|jgi:putative membrane protein|nr:SHOCT domain-containing protein [Blastococcus sp.]